MPAVSIYYQDAQHRASLEKSLLALRQFIATQLTTAERTLAKEEISLRLIGVAGGEMISPVEMEITAHAYPSRVQNQDSICRAVSEFLGQQGIPDNHVWLLLCELGHSWKE